MSNSILTLLLGVALVLVLADSACADLIIPNPDPGTFERVDPDPGLFSPAAAVFTLRLKDIGFENALPSARFGFYYAGSDLSDPANLITIFNSTDVPGAEAAIDFLGGVVYETPAYNVKETFTPTGGDIGFFLQPDPIVDYFFLGEAGIVFTEAALNPFGVDHVGTFQYIGDPLTHLLVFAGQDRNTGELVPLNFELINGARIVPEPGGLALLAGGLLALGALVRRGRRARAPHHAA